MGKEADYKRIYIHESDELLQQMNQNLLLLEKDPTNQEALNAIFRSAHTLKSMSASMGYNSITALSHKMEDLLMQLRDGAVSIDERIVNALFKSFDSLEEMVRMVHGGKDPRGNIDNLVAALDSLMAKGRSFDEDEVEEGLSLNKFEKTTLARVKKEGYSCLHVTVTLERSCVLKSVRAFMIFRNLHDIGEVIKSFPDSQALEEEKFDRTFSCIIVTKEGKRLVREKSMEVLEVEKVGVEEIPVDELWDSKGDQKQLSDNVHSSDITPGVTEHVRRIRSVRVDIDQLDIMMNLVEELAINKLRLMDIGSKFPDADLKGVIESLNRLTDDLQTEVMQARLVPVGQIFDRFPRLVRDIARSQEKKVKIDIIGGDIELDRTVLDEIGDPLIHLLRNAVDHGIETPAERKKLGKTVEGRVMLSALREKSHVIVEVADDGAGIDTEKVKKSALEKGIVTEEELSSMSLMDIYLLLAHPGFSTRKNVTDLSGRGVGLDVVKARTESLGGSVLVESTLEKGTKISMRLPITTAVVQALLIDVLNRTFAIPISSVVEIIVISEKDIRKVEHQETILHRDQVLPIMRLNDVFMNIPFPEKAGRKDAEEELGGKLSVVVLENGPVQFGVVVSRLVSQQDIVIKQLTKELKGIKGFAGATILGDGSVALVLDVGTLV